MRIVIAFCFLTLASGCSPGDESAVAGVRLPFEAAHRAGSVVQEPADDEDDETERSVPEFVDTYNKRFLSRPPEIGSSIPELTVFAEDGSDFELSATRGKYTVLVFGCLT